MRLPRTKPAFPVLKTSAFTVIELVVVVAVIVIVVGLLIPALQTARSTADRSHCAHNLRQIGMGYQLFMDNAGSNLSPFIGDSAWMARLSPYVTNNKQIFFCPNDPNLDTAAFTTGAASSGQADSQYNDSEQRIIVGLSPDGTLTVNNPGGEASDHDNNRGLILISPFSLAEKLTGQAPVPKGSYGINNAAQFLGTADQSEKVLALEYKQLVANVVGVAAPDFWPRECAPRHNGVLNVLFSDGSVRDISPADIDPRMEQIYKTHWLPQGLND
jgi:prepilin-type processing-associated H-X9-DG protein